MSRIEQRILAAARVLYPEASSYRVRTRWRCAHKWVGGHRVKNPEVIHRTAELMVDGDLQLGCSIGGHQGTEARCLRSLYGSLSRMIRWDR